MNSRLKFHETLDIKYKKLVWSEREKILNCRPYKIRNRDGNVCKVSFSLANFVKLKRSVFGTFLEEFNAPQQIQDRELNEEKLAMFNFDFKQFNPAEVKHWHDDNDFIEEGVFNMLIKAVQKEDVIREDFLYDNVHAVKFCNLPFTVVDADLRKYKNLKKLVMAGNLIRDIRGRDFPRDLRFLELFANDIDNLKYFADKPPKMLIYLGLQRNKLHDGGGLHLLGKCGRFEWLQYLDLAENDIYNLERVLCGLKELGSLLFLQLQGNPCAVLCAYKDVVLRELPKLIYLDNTEILNEDRDLFLFDVEVDAAVTFDCHWITGLPPPPKVKDVIHTFYLEISMPLLEEYIEEPEEDPNEAKQEDVIVIEKPKSKKSDKSTPKKSKKSTGNKSGKTSSKKSTSKKGKDKQPSIYDSPGNFESSPKSNKATFKTERFPWAKIIQLPEEALVIRSPDGNLADIRDTFRAGANVKLIYLQIQKPGNKKQKGGKKSKSKKEKSKKKGKKANKNETAEQTDERPKLIDEPPAEVILKEITLSSFRCNLHSINWSDKTIDYFWAKCEEIKQNAIEVQGSLRAINYKIGGKKSAKEKGKNPPDEEKDNKFPPVPLPKGFTMQVGFGLKRSYYQDF